MTITIERVHSPTSEMRQLVDELNGALAALYTEDQRHGVALDQLFQPSIRFFVVRAGGVAAGCGGVERSRQLSAFSRQLSCHRSVGPL
jgi:hypothetical protein